MSWNIVSASVIGNAHIENSIPCQDNFAYKMIDENCGIAIVADGAGSCENSHLGSAFVVLKGVELFEKLIVDNRWDKAFPTDKIWRKEAISIAKEVYEQLKVFAKKREVEFKSLSSTFIVSFFSKEGICSLNIGDGRGAFRDTQNRWHSIVTPYHGEQVGMTVFLTTTPIWSHSDLYIFTSVVKERPHAFIILSDGYEKISFECYIKDENGNYYDPNRPFDEYLNFMVEMSLKFLKDNTIEEVNKKWEQFLKNGHKLLKTESDDKTMVLGIYNEN